MSQGKSQSQEAQPQPSDEELLASIRYYYEQLEHAALAAMGAGLRIEFRISSDALRLREINLAIYPWHNVEPSAIRVTKIGEGERQ